MTNFPPAQPHGPIQALTGRLYVVRGAMRMNPVLRISRNMVIIRRGDELHRLLELEFDALIAAHGTYLPAGAKAGVRRAVDKAFGVTAGYPDDASSS